MADAIAEVAPMSTTEDLLPANAPSPLPIHDSVELPALASDTSCAFSVLTTDVSSNDASISSTPPTTITDAASIASEPSKHEITPTLPTLDDPSEPIERVVQVGTPQPDIQTPQPSSPADKHDQLTPRRARAARSTSRAPVYNLAKLTGTDIHGRRRAKGDVVIERKRPERRRTVAGDGTAAGNNGTLDNWLQRGVDASAKKPSLSAPTTPQSSKHIAKSKAAAKQKKEKTTPVVAPRISTRSSGAAAAAAARISAASSSLGKRSRKAADALANIPRELRRLQDTNEFAGIEAKPVLHTIWSNGKYIDPNDLDEQGEPVRKKTKKSPPPPKEPEPEPSKESTPTAPTQEKRVKKWLSKGLYAGQETPSNWTAGLNTADKKKLAQIPELTPPEPNKALPFPIFNGLRLLLNGRDFKLPFDVCNPLPPGQPKPDEWRKMTKNRFVGDAGTYWRKTDHFKDYQSKCVCKPHDGCAEDCQNRIMLYECDEMNCNVGKEFCQNRAFQNLAERTKKGGPYRVGVEVVKTEDRGHGVRSNRCFEPNQIIMEYTGEIITEAECERRMNEKYKDNECYYLMAFDQNMIIDATTGSIARFVNHSCDPNCRMEKWIVHGQPRMALFAGDRPIMTGEELTYDYNFDPFSAKNVQKCLCGSANCRGILGPKVSKAAKTEPKAMIKESVKAATKAGKRKLKVLTGSEDVSTSPNKKRKIAKATGGRSSISAKATAAVKKTASTIAVKGKAAIATSKAKTKKQAKSVSVTKATLIKASKTYVKNGKQLLLADSLTKSDTTIVATPKAGASSKKKATASPAKAAAKSKTNAKTTTKTKATAKTIAKTAKSGGTIKATIKSAGLKGSVQSTIKTAKHTINKAAGKKAVKKTVKKSTIKTTTTTTTKRKAKASVLEDAPIEQNDSPAAGQGGSIAVGSPHKTLDMIKSESTIRLVTDDE